MRKSSFFQQTISAIDRVEACTSSLQLENVCSLAIDSLGFNSIVALKMPGPHESYPQTIYLNTRPSLFTEEYFSEQLNLHDPVVHCIGSAKVPFLWSTAHEQAKTNAKQRVKTLAKAHNMLDGYVITVAQMSSLSVLSVSMGKNKIPQESFRALHLLGTYALAKFQEFSRKKIPHIELHKREQECLQWIAVGKTDNEIAEILNLSPNTIRMYVEKAKDKLGTPNRTAAVVQAMRQSSLYF
jgi:LuxR family transcriptional regulator, quorum-sensing system regulator BjaR1